jgi:hypothetical protein
VADHGAAAPERRPDGDHACIVQGRERGQRAASRRRATRRSRCCAR